MIEIAAGVCLGIIAAVFILNWWQDHLIRRAERRERKALRRAERQAAQDHAEWLRAYEAASHAPEPVTVRPHPSPEPVRATPRDNVLRADLIFWSIIAFMIFCAVMNGLGVH